MLRFLFAFLLATPLAFGQVEIEPATYINGAGLARGDITIPAGSGLVLPNGVPADTTNRLYNNAGILSFNGAAVAGAALTIGTASTIPRWNAVPDDLVDSQITDDGTNVTATVGGVFNVISDTIVLDTLAALDDITIDAGDDLLLGAADNIEVTASDDIYLDAGTSTIDIIDGGDILLSPAVNVTLTSGQLLLPTGLVGTPSWGWAADADGTGTGMYRSAADTIAVVNNGALRWNFTSAAFFSATANGAYIRRDAGSVAGPVYAFTNSLGNGLNNAGVGVNNVTMSVGGALVMDWEDTNAAGAGADLVTISFIPGIMDSADDLVRGLFIDPGSVDHTGGTLIGLEIDSITEDPDAFESAAFFGSGFDAHFTLTERGGAYADFPPALSQAFFVDDNADWSGGGGNDCALVWQDSTGATTVIAIRVTNGACN